MATKSKPDGAKRKTEWDEELGHLERILALMEKHELAELEWEKGNERIKFKSKHSVVANATSSVSPSTMVSSHTTQAPVTFPKEGPPLHSVAAQKTHHAKDQQKDQHKQVLSPFVGTFYRSAAPGSAPYVKEGQAIKRGDVLCIIEAMKLMNEIEAEFPGKLISVLVENGQPVEFGEPLFILEP